MESARKPRVKICCIQSVDEAWMAVQTGAAALGLVSAMPSGPGVISEEEIYQIATQVPPGVSTFLLTSKQSTTEIIAQQKRCCVNTIQIVDVLREGEYQDFRDELPGIKVVQVVHVTGPESVTEAVDLSQKVDAILLDSGNPNLAIKEIGGTGRTHNWLLSKTIREKVACPVYLAGGLKPGNIADAFATVAPFGLDICSGVRTDGKLDQQKLKSFFDEINKVVHL